MEFTEFLRQYFWTALLLAIIVVSLLIVMIFIIINVCISKRVAWYSTQSKPNHYSHTHFKNQDNQVHHKEVQHKDLENEKPPLPSRDQFRSMDSVDHSYEDVDPTPDYVEIEDESKPPVPQQPTVTPHYAIVETKSQEQDAVSEDYDDVDMPANNDSEEDYDDIG